MTTPTNSHKAWTNKGGHVRLTPGPVHAAGRITQPAAGRIAALVVLEHPSNRQA
jgi:hypothetical protein